MEVFSVGIGIALMEKVQAPSTFSLRLRDAIAQNVPVDDVLRLVGAFITALKFQIRKQTKTVVVLHLQSPP